MQLVKGQKDFEAAGAKIIAAADQNATQAISTTLEIKNKLQKEGDTTTEIDFPILIDIDGEAGRLYDVVDDNGDKPSIFIIDRFKKIQWSYISRDESDRPTPEQILENVPGQKAIAIWNEVVSNLQVNSTEGITTVLTVDATSMSTQSAEVNHKDFIAVADFRLPSLDDGEKWSFGLSFRRQGSLFPHIGITSGKEWRIRILGTADGYTDVDSGQLVNLDLEENRLILFVRERRVIVFLNGVLIADSLLPTDLDSGDIDAITGLYKGDTAGKEIEAINFRVWSLD